jgi:hypothetical protein
VQQEKKKMDSSKFVTEDIDLEAVPSDEATCCRMLMFHSPHI